MNLNTTINNKIYFEFAKNLFSQYNTLKSYKELCNDLFELSIKYNIQLDNLNNIRNTYNTVINKYYHNEITIKSNFVNNILFKSNNHITIFELNLESSRVDLCKINGKSIAFEIKTDLDNFNRLEKQLRDYSEIFDEVYVICSKNNIKNIYSLIPDYCGLYSYDILNNSYYKFTKEKKTIPIKNLNNFKQLNLLTKKELKNYFKKISYIENKELMIKEILLIYSSKYINSTFKKILKNRYRNKWEFLRSNSDKIYEIDYQWFFKNNINPEIIYQ